MIRVYTASKISTAPEWRDIHATHPHVHFHARWLKHNLKGTPDRADFASKFWLEDERDVHDCEALIVWAREGEHLRGALVEVGMAIAFGKPVIVVGTHADYSTWQHHPQCQLARDLAHALELLVALDIANGTHQDHGAHP
jgi:hypothetical protein